MKKIFLSIAMAAAAAAVTVSCNKTELAETPNVPVNTVKLSVNAGNPVSKVTIGDKAGASYPMSWDAADERVKVAEVVDSAKGNFVVSSSYALDGGKAYFSFNLAEKEGRDFDYYFVSPASAFKSVNAYSSYRYITVAVPKEQTPFASSADTAAVLLYGKSLNHTSQGGSLDVNFKALSAFGKLKVKDLSAAIGAGESVSGFEITAVGKKFAGDARYYYDTDYMSVQNGSNTIALDLKNISTGSDFNVWFSCLPFSLDAGDTLIFVAYTDVDFYKKTAVVPSARAFTAGNVTEFTVDMSTATGSPDYSGTYAALIKNSGNNYWAMSNESDSKSRLLARDVEYDGGGNFTATDSSIVWKFERIGGMVYSVKNGGKYLGWDGKDNVAVLLDSTYLLTLVKNGDVFNILSVENPERKLQKNNSNAYFAFYTGSNKSDFHLIPAVVDLGPVIKPIEGQTVAAAKDTFDVACTVVNPTGATLGAAPDDGSWLNVLSTDNNVIKIAVDENTGAERTDTITVSYTGAKSIRFAVKQNAAGAIDPIVLDLTTKKIGFSNYSSTCSYDDWKIKYGANSNKGWAYFKMGGKAETLVSANPCEIWYTKKVTNSISKVTVHIPSGSFSKSGMSVNSWGVYVYSDESMKTQIDFVAGGTITKGENAFTFIPNAEKVWKDCYVKVSWDLANTTTTNGVVCVDNVTIAF